MGTAKVLSYSPRLSWIEAGFSDTALEAAASISDTALEAAEAAAATEQEEVAEEVAEETAGNSKRGVPPLAPPADSDHDCRENFDLCGGTSYASLFLLPPLSLTTLASSFWPPLLLQVCPTR